MEKKTNNNPNKNQDFIWVIVLFMFFIIVLAIGSGAYYLDKLQGIKDDIQQSRTDYYRNQMLNFCKAAEKNDPNVNNSCLYPCERWVIR